MLLQFAKQLFVPADFKRGGGNAVLDGVSLKTQNLRPVASKRKLLTLQLLKTVPDRARVILASSICRM